MLIDKPLAELELYKPPLTRQHDFDAFWEQTLNESTDQPLNATLEEVRYLVERITVYRVHYDGFGPATRIAGWYLVPKDHYRLESEGRTHTIVQYHGYSGGKGVLFSAEAAHEPTAADQAAVFETAQRPLDLAPG